MDAYNTGYSVNTMVDHGMIMILDVMMSSSKQRFYPPDVHSLQWNLAHLVRRFVYEEWFYIVVSNYQR